MSTQPLPPIAARGAECAALSAVVEAACRGRGGVTLLTGEAGVGKSRLARHAADEAARLGVAVLTGRAVEADSPVPLRPFAETVLAAHRCGVLPEVADLEPYRRVLAPLVPSWRTAATGSRGESLLVTAEALLRVLSTTGRGRGALVVLEDLHWADPETLAVLEYLGDHLDAEPVRVLGTVRPGEQRRADACVAALRSRRAADVLPLARLPADAVTQMLRDRLSGEPPPDVLRFVTARADGLPLFVEELLGGLLDAGALVERENGWAAVSRLVVRIPMTFRETVRERLRRLPPPHRRVVEAAAVLGRDFDCALLPEVAGVSVEEAREALRAAVDRQLLVAEESAIRFRHALTRDAVLDDMLPVDRADVAAVAARAVDRGRPLDDDACALAGSLYDAGGLREPAVALLHESARRSLARGSLQSARTAAERAQALADDAARPRVGVTLLEVLVLSGAVDEAEALARDLLARADCEPQLRVAVALLVSRAAVTAGRWEEAGRHLDFARHELGRCGDAGAVARVDALAAHAAIGAGDPARGVALAERALAAAEACHLAEVSCEALEVIGRAARQGDVRCAEQAFERARRTAESAGLEVWRARALHELGTVDLFDSGRLDRLAEARLAAASTGALATVAVVDFHIGTVLWVRARFDEARAAARSSAGVARRLALPVLPAALGLLASCDAAQGRDRGMRHHEREMVDAFIAALDLPGEHAALVYGDGPPADPELEVAVWGRLRGIRALTDADDVRARRAFDRAMAALRARPTVPFPMRGAWALLRTVADARDPARDEVRASDAMGLRLVRVSLAYAEAVAHGTAGDPAAAHRAFAEGEAEVSQYADPQWWGHTLRRITAEAAIRDGWGEPVEWLREANAWFEENEHQRQAARCRALLKAARAPVPRRGRGESAVPSALRSLGVTSREMDVLRLVAQEGLSNADVARRLFLSPRTVEKHVGSLLARTGTRSRDELADVVARLSALAPR